MRARPCFAKLTATALAAGALLTAATVSARPEKIDLSTSTIATIDPNGGLPFAGEILYHRIDLRNTGNTTAADVTVDVELSPGVKFRKVISMPQGAKVKFGATRLGAFLARIAGLQVPAGRAAQIVLQVEATGDRLAPLAVEFPNPEAIPGLTGGHDASEFSAFAITSRAWIAAGIKSPPILVQSDDVIITGVVLADIEVGLREFGDAPFFDAEGDYAFPPIAHCQTYDPPQVYDQTDGLPMLGLTFSTETELMLHDSASAPDADGCANADIDGTGDRDQHDDGVSIGPCQPTPTRTCVGPGPCPTSATCLRIDAFVPSSLLLCSYPAGLWVNVLIDTDQTGHWNPEPQLLPACSDEWLVRDYQVTGVGVRRLQMPLSSLGLSPSPTDSSFRVRVMLGAERMATRMVFFGLPCFNGFPGFQCLLCGETEDYVLRKVGTTFSLDAPVPCP